MNPEAAKADPLSGRLRYPHLAAAFAAVVILLAGSLTVLVRARARVRSSIAVLAPMTFPQKWRGVAVQREAFRHDELLPMYGSSELVVPMRNRATEFFGGAPTGFSMVPVGDHGSTPLSYVLRLGSLGDAVRGRKVVISASGTWFEVDNPLQVRAAFAANYSALQTGDFLFRSALPPALKQRVALRLLRYYDAIGPDALLRTALICTARPCAIPGIMPALAAIWTLRSFPMRVLDYANSASEAGAGPPIAQRVSNHPDWPALEAKADSSWRLQSASNRFGIQDGVWARWSAILQAREGSKTDSAFLRIVRRSPQWTDFELLLATLDAEGARALVLNTPLKGPFLNFTGVSPEARVQFYDRFRAVTAPYRFVTRDFREYDADPNFLSEPGSHLSMKGWLIYDRIIDAFYHDSIR